MGDFRVADIIFRNMFLICTQCWPWSGVVVVVVKGDCINDLHTGGGDHGAVEVVAGLLTDCESCLTDLFPFLITLAVLPIVLFMVEEDMLLVKLFSSTNWQLPDGWSGHPPSDNGGIIMTITNHHKIPPKNTQILNHSSS